MTIKPLNKVTEAEDVTKDGIILAGFAKEKPQVAKIVEVGLGKYH